MPPKAKAPKPAQAAASASREPRLHTVELLYKPKDSGAAHHSVDNYSISSHEEDPMKRLVDHASRLTGIPKNLLCLTTSNGDALAAEDLRDDALFKVQRVCAGQEGETFREHISTIPSTKLYANMTKDLNFCFALSELIDNSVEATKTNVEKERLIEVRLDQKARKLEVCDNGYGMSVDEMRDFSRLGESNNRYKNQLKRTSAIKDPDERDKYFMTSELSRFGLGAKNAMFYFGPTVKLSSKVKESRYVYRVLVNQREIERTKEHHAELECEAAEPDELAEGNFTHIEVTNVAEERLDEYFKNRTAVLKFLSEVYHFYLYGGFKRDPRRDAGELHDGFTPVTIAIVENDGSEELHRWELGPVQDEAAAKKLPREALLNEVRQVHEAFFPAAADAEAAAAGDDDSKFARQGDKELQWETTIEVPLKEPDTGSVVRASVTLSAVYFPLRKNKPTTPPGFSPGLFTVWQGRCMPSEKLNAVKQTTGQRLSFMEKQSSKASVPPECWDRFKGFLFLSRIMEPTCHKTQMAETDNYELLVRMDRKSETWQKLRKEFLDRLKQWHAQDDEVAHGPLREPYVQDKVEVGRCVEEITFGKQKYNLQAEIKLRWSGKVYLGWIIKMIVYDAKFIEQKSLRNEPYLMFRQICLPGEKHQEWPAPVSDIVGPVKDKEWKEELEKLRKRTVKGVRFVDRDEFIKRPMPKEIKAGEVLEYVAAEAYNKEEEAGRQRVQGMELRSKVPQLWLLLYMRKADMEVAIEKHTFKSVKPEAAKLGNVPEELRSLQVPRGKEGKAAKEKEEFVAMTVIRISANDVERDLFYARDIMLPHRGAWKFRLVPMRSSGGKKGEAAAPTMLPDLEAETRDVQVLPGPVVQLEAEWRAGAGARVGVGELLPEILVFPQDQFANPLVGRPGADVVAGVKVTTAKNSDFEVVEGYAKAGMSTENRGWVLVSKLRLRVKEGRAVKLPAEVTVEVRFGEVRNKDTCQLLDITVASGPPCRLELLPGALKGGGPRGPAVARLSTLDELQLRAVDAHGNPADVEKGVQVKLQGEGVDIPSSLSSRPLPGSATLDYGGKVRVTGPYGSACELRAAIEGRSEPPLVIPFTVAPRRLRLVLPDPLPDGVALVAAPVPPAAGGKRRAPAAGSARKKKRGEKEAASPAAPAALVDLDEEEGGEADADEAAPLAWELRVRHGAALKGVSVEVVDPADWSCPDPVARAEAVEVSWAPDQGPKFVGGRAKLPPLVPSQLEKREGEGEEERRAFVAFAGLRADLHFHLYSEPPAALVLAGGGPPRLRAREPAAVSLQLRSASDEPVPSAAFARSARLTAELLDSALTLETAPTGLTLTAGDEGLLTVAGFSVRGCVGEAPASAVLRLRVAASEPELPEEGRALDVPLTVAHGPAARIVWRPREAAPAGGLRVLNGGLLPAIVVRAEDADGGLATTHAGMLSVAGPEGVEARGQPRYVLHEGQALLADIRVTAAPSLLGEDRLHSLRILHSAAPRTAAVRRRGNAPASGPPAQLAEAEPVRVAVLPNPDRPAALRLLDGGAPAASLRATAGAALPSLTAEVQGETGRATRLPTGAILALSMPSEAGGGRWEGQAEEREGQTVYTFPGFTAPLRAGDYSLSLALEGPEAAALAAAAARLLVAPGPPAGLRAAGVDGAWSLALTTNATLPDIAVRLVDEHGNGCPPPTMAFAVACRSEATREGGTAPRVSCAPRVLAADGTAVFGGLTVGEAASGNYALLFTLEPPLEGVAPASLPFSFSSEVEQRAEQEKSRQRAEEMRRLAATIAGLEQERTAKQEELRQAKAAEESASAQVEQLRRLVGDVPDLEACARELGRRLEGLRAAGPAASLPGTRVSSICRTPHDRVQRAYATFTEQHRRQPFPGFVGFVAEMAKVEDDRVAEGLACFLADRAQAAVFELDAHIRDLRRRRDLYDLSFIPIGSFTEDAFCPERLVDRRDPQLRLALQRAPPAGARYLVNELVLERPELRRTLWYYLLRDALVVESEEARNAIVDRAWHGRIEQPIVVLPRVDERTGRPDPASCDITRKNAIVRAGQRNEPRAVFASTRSLQDELAATQQRLADCRALLDLQETLAERGRATRRARAELEGIMQRAQPLQEQIRAHDGASILQSASQPRATVASTPAPAAPAPAAKRARDSGSAASSTTPRKRR